MTGSAVAIMAATKHPAISRCNISVLLSTKSVARKTRPAPSLAARHFSSVVCDFSNARLPFSAAREIDPNVANAVPLEQEGRAVRLERFRRCGTLSSTLVEAWRHPLLFGRAGRAKAT